MIYRTTTTGIAALLQADGRFVYQGIEGSYYIFEGEPGLTPVLTQWVQMHAYFRREFQKVKKRRTADDSVPTTDA
jgi:hypothetical protein